MDRFQIGAHVIALAAAFALAAPIRPGPREEGPQRRLANFSAGGDGELRLRAGQREPSGAFSRRHGESDRRPDHRHRLHRRRRHSQAGHHRARHRDGGQPVGHRRDRRFRRTRLLSTWRLQWPLLPSWTSSCCRWSRKKTTSRTTASASPRAIPGRIESRFDCTGTGREGITPAGAIQLTMHNSHRAVRLFRRSRMA